MAKAANGYIKLYRTLVDWEWWDDIPVRLLWITILMEANWKDKKWKGKKIKRGSLWTSIDSLSEKTGLSRQQVRTALAKLKATREITCKSTREGTLITVVNYGLYQDDDATATYKTTHKRTDKQQTTNKRATLTEEYIKNSKEGEEGDPPAEENFFFFADID